MAEYREEQYEEYAYEQARARAHAYYCANFSAPFTGNPPVPAGGAYGVPRATGSHTGIDWSGSFGVYAPHAGTVVRVGSSQEAGMWKIGKPVLNESGNVAGYKDVREWSVFSSRTDPPLYTWHATQLEGETDPYYEPERLLASGEYADIATNWSHTEGTVVDISHGHYLYTRYEHMDSLGNMTVSEGQVISQGELIGNTGNNGFSTGAHLHYGVQFRWHGRSEWFNPICP